MAAMIGVFGGTFDPIHFGHLRTALELYQSLGVAELRLIPCRQPPHRDAPRASAAQRLAMLNSAVRGQAGLVVDERELRRDGPSYSVLTLRELREAFPDTPLCMIVGTDAFAALDTWWQWREILTLCHVVIVERRGAVAVTGELAEVLSERRVAKVAELAARPAGRIITRSVTPLDISATGIRDMIGQGLSPRYLLPESVLAIIRDQAIYKTTT
jgi:nicotinate-nucleotide adenylyltransferase